MKWNKKIKQLGLACLTALLLVLAPLPVLAADKSPELLITKGDTVDTVKLTLTNLGEKSIKGFSLELKLTNDQVTFTDQVIPSSSLDSEDTRVKLAAKEGGNTATLAVTRKGLLPSGTIDIGTLTLKGKAGEKYTLEATNLEVVNASDYQKETTANVPKDKNSAADLMIEKTTPTTPETPDNPDNPNNPSNPSDNNSGGTNQNPSGTGSSTNDTSTSAAHSPYGASNPFTGVIKDPTAAIFVTLGILTLLISGLLAFKVKKAKH